MLCMYLDFFCFIQKTEYGMSISDWSSDVCSSDLLRLLRISHLHRFLFARRLRCLPPLAQIFEHARRFAAAARLEAMVATRRQIAFVHLRREPRFVELPVRKHVVYGKSVAVGVDHGGGRISKQ